MLKYFLVVFHTYGHISWSATKPTIRWSKPHIDPMYWIGFQGLANPISSLPDYQVSLSNVFLA